jgi:ATP-binding cassette, subfamily C, bacterial LapB
MMSAMTETLPERLVVALLLAQGLARTEADAEAGVASLANEKDPVAALRSVLKKLKRDDARVVLWPWQRFDQRRLPVLINQNGSWFLAEDAGSAAVRLVSPDGTTSEHGRDRLGTLAVLAIVSRQAAHAESGAGSAARLLLTAMFRDRRWLANVAVATVVVNMLGVFTSLFAMQVYDRVVPTMAWSTLVTLVAGMGVVFSLDWVLRMLRTRTLDAKGIEVDREMSRQVFDHLLRLRLDRQPKSIGVLAAQVSALDSVRQFLSAGVVFSLIDLPFALLFVACIGVVGGSVAFVYLALFPVAVGLGLLIHFRLRRLARAQMTHSNERQGLLVDALRGAETVRAGNYGWRIAEEWDAIGEVIAATDIQQKAARGLLATTTQLMSSAAYVAAVVVGVLQVEAGNLTTGGMVACSILGGRVIPPVAQAVQYLSQWQQVSQILRNVDRILQLPRMRRPGQTLVAPSLPPSRVAVEKLRFGYAGSPVMQLQIDQLEFRAGDRVLLVGPVGSGKSTLLKVLAGLYPPVEGRIKLGDADLWEIDPEVMTARVAYLPQTVHLFKGSLRSNLSLSGSAVSDERMLQVVRELGIDALAEDSPLGMDREVNEGGEGLSGGQRQLVALARTIAAGPRVWLLDEPTASLDTETEAKVWQVLGRQLGPEDILVVSTHRPRPAMGLVNRVVAMRHGRVVNDGAPEVVLPPRPARPRPIHRDGQGASREEGLLDVI